MNTEEINLLLKRNEKYLLDWFSQVEEERWGGGPTGKWTAGQHLLHLIT